MPDDLEPLQQAQAGAIDPAYGLVRYEQPSRKGTPLGWWTAVFRRQGRAIQRSFADHAYGGQEMARIMAAAWRDAAMRLAPPVTKRQFQNRLRSSNTSGVPGVTARYVQGQLVAWRAILQTPERIHTKSFSIKAYGSRAKELAIAERQHLLDQYGVDAFINLNQKSSQDFAYLLEHPQLIPDPAQVAQHLDVLNQWFDQLLPERLSVALNVYHSPVNASIAASMRIAAFGQRNNRVTKGLQLIRRGYSQRLPEWWQFMETTITAWHGRQRWLNFAARHESAFMASTAESGFQVRDYDAPLGYPQCLTPPALLQPMLTGFELPALPYWMPAPKMPDTP